MGMKYRKRTGTCVLKCQGNDIVISELLPTGSLYAKRSLNSSLFTCGQNKR